MLKYLNRNVNSILLSLYCTIVKKNGIYRWYLYKMIAIKSSNISLAILINLIICDRKVCIFRDYNADFSVTCTCKRVATALY